jgi:hypothetical protein
MSTSEPSDGDTGDRAQEDARPQHFVAYHDPPEVRQAHIEAMTVAVQTAGPDFGAAVNALEVAAAGANPYRTMAAMTFYLGSSKVGTNPEYNRPLGIFQHDLEIAQAVLFRDPGPVQPDLSSDRVQSLSSAIKDYGDAWMLLQMQKVQRARDDQERRRERLIAQLRVRAAINRGWGYQDRIDGMLDALLAPLGPLREELGFAPGDLPVFWRAMRGLVTKRIADHRQALRDASTWPVDEHWLDRIAQRFGRLEPEPPEGWVAAAQHDENARDYYLINCADLRLPEIFHLRLDDLVAIWPGENHAETVRAVVSAWAAPLETYGGLDLAKLPLTNPVMSRPLICDADDSWHLYCGWLLLHNAFGLIETAMAGHDNALEQYRDRRTVFLEERVAELLSSALPTATVERSVLSIDPNDGKEYENDVVALTSSFAVIAEAKAGGLHPDLRHGKLSVLKDRVAGLVGNPSNQALRLADVLETSTGEIPFRRRADGAAFTVDAGAIRRTLTLGVTLEPIALMLPRLVEVADAGLSPETAEALAFSINILDLEVVVDVLQHPSELLHYLGRRAQIERSVFLGGDEIDLLALYLETWFNLGEREFSGDVLLEVTGLSDAIDVWHYRTEAGMPADPPRAVRTEWWERVLTRVEQRAMPRWAEIGVTLCNVAPPEQDEFREAMTRLREEIVSDRRPSTDIVAFYNGPPQRRDLIVGAIAASPDPAQRQQQYADAIASALDGSGLSRATLLAWTPTPIEPPYFALAVYDATDADG